MGEAASGADGHFLFKGIAPGVYAVTGDKTGFDTATAVVALETGKGASAEPTLAAHAALDLNLAAKQLEEARVGDIINLLDETSLLRSHTGLGEFASQFAPRRSVFVGVRTEF